MAQEHESNSQEGMYQFPINELAAAFGWDEARMQQEIEAGRVTQEILSQEDGLMKVAFVHEEMTVTVVARPTTG